MTKEEISKEQDELIKDFLERDKKLASKENDIRKQREEEMRYMMENYATLEEQKNKLK